VRKRISEPRKGWVAACLALLSPMVWGEAAGPVTFTRDIAPILFENCVGCHRPGEVGPMSLLSYDEARPWAKSIREAVVVQRRMPPWHADAPRGVFKNDRRLEDAEIALIDRWITQGCPKGDEADLPEAPRFVEGWQLGEPDYVLEFPPFDVPAEGPDQLANLPFKVDLPEDRWVRAIEIRPSNRQVVHHVIAFVADRPNAGVQGWLAAWAAGAPPAVFPEQTGRLVKAGAVIVANMHYHPMGTAGRDQTRIGLYFADKPVEREVINLWVMNNQFVIPPGAGNHEVTATHTFEQDSVILSVAPHMHYRGKDMLMKAVFPDGRERVLVNVPNYDFNWQTFYEPVEPIQAPKGTRIEIVAHFDNSTGNPANPDPNKTVTFGLASTDEMMIGFVDYVPVAAPEASGGQ